jgi:hypothetical protein
MRLHHGSGPWTAPSTSRRPSLARPPRRRRRAFMPASARVASTRRRDSGSPVQASAMPPLVRIDEIRSSGRLPTPARIPESQHHRCCWRESFSIDRAGHLPRRRACACQLCPASIALAVKAGGGYVLADMLCQFRVRACAAQARTTAARVRRRLLARAVDAGARDLPRPCLLAPSWRRANCPDASTSGAHYSMLVAVGLDWVRLQSLEFGIRQTVA